MVKTVLYAEKLYDNDKVEREVFGSDVRVVWRNVSDLSQLEEKDCAIILTSAFENSFMAGMRVAALSGDRMCYTS